MGDERPKFRDLPLGSQIAVIVVCGVVAVIVVSITMGLIGMSVRWGACHAFYAGC